MPEQPDKQQDDTPPATIEELSARAERTLHAKAGAKRRGKSELAYAVIAVVAGIAGLLGSLVTLPVSWLESDFTVQHRELAADLYEKLKAEQEIKFINGRLAELDSRISALSAPPDGSQEALQIKELSANVAKLQESVSDMERLIMDNPSKALAMPLMRKDLDSLKENNQAEMTSLRKDIDRIYDLNKWLVGLMFTMALGVLTLAISNFWKAKEKVAEAGQTEGSRDAPAAPASK
ncbi:MAG: hypothetical protein ABW007_26675 [Chitinophagaceae bacterium]